MNDAANREVFDQLADGWYNFRHYTIFRSELEALSKRWEKGKLLNLGCGHGADFLPFKDSFQLHGLDFSFRMIELARRYARKFTFQPDLLVGDMRSLPYAGETFDWAVSVAALHHIQGPAERLGALRELRRVLKPGAEAFLTVWNRCQRRFWFKGRETYVPWQAGGTTLQRYYYLFTYGELENAVKEAGFRLLSSQAESTYRGKLKYFSRNICLLVKKEGK
jgi:tRNA (uracil-5-)-methyltransferase TRM9